MGHAGMAATAVRYLRSVGAATTAATGTPPEALPRPDLRAVRDDERPAVAPDSSGAYWATSPAASP